MELKHKNINRGYVKLRVWNDAIKLFKLVYRLTDKNNFPHRLQKIRSNLLDASHSISRNISEGYCRKNLKEYLNFLNIALGSSGETLSGIISLSEVNILSENEFKQLDELHFQMENELLALIKSLQQKQKNGVWENSFAD
ncbi:MAG: four helix bundle protein [Melioribacteraceae bacterium]|nr:four helix bundle protein [Melioribacteraceae bacterium]MCF8356090.1 four helix bundle protein [Melioribacteraceae bacterium]MCF8395545.1 four helix bundle protein [Melioribacteraceae bacterium]MCF8420617.1 four helix bundle protein [Melioribacteraceae bacterium]